jgi:hypothetical protein
LSSEKYGGSIREKDWDRVSEGKLNRDRDSNKDRNRINMNINKNNN